MVSIVFILLGLIVLIKAADFFVDSAVEIADLLRIPKLIIGATVVSLATTLPELFVSINATINGENEMAIGNAIGSVIFNTGVILSLAAIFLSGPISKSAVEKMFLLVVTLLTIIVFTRDLTLIWYEGGILLLLVGVFLYLNLRGIKNKKEDFTSKPSKTLLANIIILVFSAIGIFIGSRLLVIGAIDIARDFRLSEQVIGVTILAMGTSLPELTTTITSIIKKQKGISIGNIIGANILNVTLIIGLSAVISSHGLLIKEQKLWPLKQPIPQTLFFDVPIAILLSLIFFFPIYETGKIRRWQGIVGLFIYFCYFALLLTNIR